MSENAQQATQPTNTPQQPEGGASVSPQQSTSTTHQDTPPASSPGQPSQQVGQQQASGGDTGGLGGQPGGAFDMQQFFQMASQMQQQQQESVGTTQEPAQQQAGEPKEGDTGKPKDDVAEQIEARNKVPDHWDKYNAPENIPAGEALKKMAHRMGLTQGQFEGVLHNMQTYNQAAKIAEIQALRNAGGQFIKEKWGDNAEYELNLARKALRTVDDNGQLQRLFDQTGYGNHPVVLNFFNKLGRQLKEGGFLRGSLRNPAGQKKTPAQRLFPNHPSNQ